MSEVASLAGALHADFTPQCGTTAAHITHAAPPLELRGPFARGSASSFFLRNISCGVFAGDQYDVRLRTTEGAHALVSSSSATKVHSMPSGSAVSRIHLEADAGSHLVFADGPTILQAGSEYEQHVEIVAGDGVVVYAETLVLGRLAGGEHAEFERYTSEIAVVDPAGRSLFVERYSLAAHDRELITGASAPVIGKVLLIGQPAAAPASTLSFIDRAYAGLDALPNGAGVAVRFMSDQLEPATQAIAAITANIIRSCVSEGLRTESLQLPSSCGPAGLQC